MPWTLERASRATLRYSSRLCHCHPLLIAPISTLPALDRLQFAPDDEEGLVDALDFRESIQNHFQSHFQVLCPPVPEPLSGTLPSCARATFRAFQYSALLCQSHFQVLCPPVPEPLSGTLPPVPEPLSEPLSGTLPSCARATFRATFRRSGRATTGGHGLPSLFHSATARFACCSFLATSTSIFSSISYFEIFLTSLPATIRSSPSLPPPFPPFLLLPSLLPFLLPSHLHTHLSSLLSRSPFFSPQPLRPPPSAAAMPMPVRLSPLAFVATAAYEETKIHSLLTPPLPSSFLFSPFSHPSPSFIPLPPTSQPHHPCLRFSALRRFPPSRPNLFRWSLPLRPCCHASICPSAYLSSPPSAPPSHPPSSSPPSVTDH
ncbi:unnamed protein product [Closterium sp. NIES-65]|nr:unnamed protein product [Closterium sp. NIES-65]